MTLWRWFGSLIFVAALMVLIGANLSATAQDKDKDKTAQDKASQDKAAQEKAAKEKTALEKAAQEKAAQEKAAQEKAAQEKAAQEKAAKEKAAQAPKEPAKTEAAKGWVWKAFEPKSVFYQELETNTTQDMKVMGQEISQKQKQVFYLKWTAEDKKDGNYVVSQEIIGLKMHINIGGNNIVFDSTDKAIPQNPMTDFFKALLGLKLKFTIAPDMTIKDIEGEKQFIEKLGGANPQMEPLLKHILSRDALQQMAEPTWGALPDREVKKGDSWGNSKKPNILNLGPIGTYTTTFTYTYEGKDDKNREKVNIKSDLKYTKPEMKNGLPFTIKDATLASTKGSGVALFDPAKGRFVETTMEMELKGDLTIEVGGMETKVSLTQVQNARSTTSDEPPAALNKK